MKTYFKIILLLAMVLLAWSPSAVSQTFPAQATGIFTLSDGNELRMLQTLPAPEVQGIYSAPQKEKLADFKGVYDKSTGRLAGQLTYCGGKKENLTIYFTRNDVNATEIYFGSAPNDRKDTGARKGNTRPTLAFDCPAGIPEQVNEPFLGKGSWTGTWKTDLGVIRLIQINDIQSGKVYVSGDFQNNGVIHLIDFSGNTVEGEYMSATRGDGVFKITRINDARFEGSYKWGLQTEWTPWGGVRTDAKLPQLTSPGAQHFITRLLDND